MSCWGEVVSALNRCAALYRADGDVKDPGAVHGAELAKYTQVAL